MLYLLFLQMIKRFLKSTLCRFSLSKVIILCGEYIINQYIDNKQKEGIVKEFAGLSIILYSFGAAYLLQLLDIQISCNRKTIIC